MASSLWRKCAVSIYICAFYVILVDTATSEQLQKVPSGVQAYADQTQVMIPSKEIKGGDTMCYPVHSTMCPRSYGIDQLVLRPTKKYIPLHSLGGGFFGDTWLVTHIFDQTNHFVLKKIRPQADERTSFYLSWKRERYFGEKISKMKGNKYFGRFVESFHEGDDLYLISLFEGKTLKSLIYDGERQWWIWIKTTKEGQQAMKRIIFQLLEALDFCEKNNITHRDVKPSNIVMCPVRCQGSCMINPNNTEFRGDMHIRLIDFGIAMDGFSNNNLYGSRGPSGGGQYALYLAPEAILNDSWLHRPSLSKYDAWTVGQVIMELILGVPDVFIPPKRLAELLFESLDKEDARVDFYYKLFGWGQFCISPVGYGHSHLMNCNEDKFAAYVRSRDPFHIGFPDVSLLPLVRHLLRGDPNFRISAGEALKYAYFQELNKADSWLEKWKKVFRKVVS